MFPIPIAREQVVRTDVVRMHATGATVTVRRDDGRAQTFRIVGEDEAEPARGSISYVSPLARAVLGGIIGDDVEVTGGNATITEIK